MAEARVVNLMPLACDGSAPENARPNAAVPGKFFRFFKDKQREVTFQFRMPDDYNAGAALKLIYTTEDGASGDIRLTAEVMATGDGEVREGTASYDTANAATDTVEATVGETNALSITLTNADNVAAGDLVNVRLRRTPAHASDTLEADMRLYAIDLYYTTA